VNLGIANQITLLRLVLCFPLVYLLEIKHPYAWSLFVFAAITDFLDGYLARRLNQITDLGKLLDPLVDKLLVSAGLVALVLHGDFPAWAVSLTLFREFLVTGLRALEAQKGLIIPAGITGKWKAMTQMIGLVVALLAWQVPWLMVFAQVILFVSVILSSYSGIEYIWRSRQLFTT
jgi:CDP-diacylglycerol---glycerol-3-phosphate 3-phosphatidyltransferase